MALGTALGVGLGWHRVFFGAGIRCDIGCELFLVCLESALVVCPPSGNVK